MRHDRCEHRLDVRDRSRGQRGESWTRRRRRRSDRGDRDRGRRGSNGNDRGRRGCNGNGRSRSDWSGCNRRGHFDLGRRNRSDDWCRRLGKLRVGPAEREPDRLALVDSGQTLEEMSVALVDTRVGSRVLVHAKEAIATLPDDDHNGEADER